MAREKEVIVFLTKNKLISLGIAVVILLLLVGGCERKSEMETGNSIQIKGSDTMVNLVQAWAESYMKEHPEAFIAVTGGGSGTGLASLLNNTCNIATSSRKIKEEEIELAKKKGINPVEGLVALDGLAVIVHPSNPISQLTISQLSDIFTNKVTNWKEYGGKDTKIVVLSREINSGTHVYFKEHVLKEKEFAPSVLLMPSSQAIADEIAHNPNTIGYYGMGYVSPAQKAIAIAKSKDSNYVEPTPDNVINGSYEISRPLIIYTNGQPQGLVKNFIDFMLSDEGQKIVLETDFVPIQR